MTPHTLDTQIISYQITDTGIIINLTSSLNENVSQSNVFIKPLLSKYIIKLSIKNQISSFENIYNSGLSTYDVYTKERNR